MNTVSSLSPAPRLLPGTAVLFLAAAAPALAWPFVPKDLSTMEGRMPRIAVFQADTGRPPECTMGRTVMRHTGDTITSIALPDPDPDPYYPSDPNVRFRTRSAVAGDLDGDGDTDLVVSCGVYYGDSQFIVTDDLRMMVCLNDGNGNYSRGWHWKTHSAAEEEPVLHLADMDNDGDLDLVEGFDSVRVRWNPGNGDFSASSSVLDSINLKGGRHDFASGDFNRDGLTDLVAFGYHRVPLNDGYSAYGRSVLYSGKQGGGYTVTILATLPESDSYVQAEPQDLDGDGLVDLVFSRFAAPSSIAWMRNNGAGFDATATLVFLPNYATCHFALGDMDEDGRKDIVFATEAKRLAWVRGTGPATFAPEATLYALDTGLPDPRALAIVDWDSDGDLDVVFNSGSTLLENTGIHCAPAAFRLPWAGTSPGAGTVDLHTAFITGDGRQDLIATDPAGQRILIYPGGNSSLLSPLTLSTSGEAPNCVTAGDIDGDGITDIAWTTGSAVKWARNVSGTGIGWTTQTALTLAGANQVVAADVEGDGDVDLLVSSTGSNSVRWLLNNGTGSAWTSQTVATGVSGVQRLAVGQTIPGGRQEVEMVSAVPDSTAAWRRYEYSAPAGAWSPVVTVNQPASSGEPASTGLALGRFVSDFAVPASAFKAGAMTNQVQIRPGATSALHQLHVANLNAVDWDRDGFDDLLCSGSPGITFFRQAGYQSVLKWQPVYTMDLSPAAMADAVPFDLNHDARMDAVCVESGTGKLHVIYNTSSPLTVAAAAVNGASTTLKIVAGAQATAVNLTVRNLGRSVPPAGQSPDAPAVPENCEFVFRRAVPSGSGTGTGYIPGLPLTDAEINAVVKNVRFGNASSTPLGTVNGRFTLPLSSFIQAAQAVNPGAERVFALGLELESTALSATVTRFFVDAGGAAAAPPRWFPLSTTGAVGPVPLSLDTSFPVTPSVLVEVTAPTPLQQWRMANFNTYDSAGTAANDADPDKDGVPNLVEYVTGRNPKSAAAAEAADAALRLTWQGPGLPILADAVLLNSYDPAVRVTIEKSTGLNAWSEFAARSPDGTWSGITPFTFSLTGGRTRLLFNTALQPATTPACYFRLKVKETP